MKKSTLFLVLGCVTGLGAARLAPATDPLGATPPRPALINHIAFFNLIDPADSDALIAACDEMAGAIPGITYYFSGAHVDTGRDSILSDYDVGFYVGFGSFETYEAYVSHPAHTGLVKDWGPRLESLRVYDVLDQSP